MIRYEKRVTMRSEQTLCGTLELDKNTQGSTDLEGVQTLLERCDLVHQLTEKLGSLPRLGLVGRQQATPQNAGGGAGGQ